MKIALLTLLLIFAGSIAIAPAITSINVSLPLNFVEVAHRSYSIYLGGVQPAGDPGGGGWPC